MAQWGVSLLGIANLLALMEQSKMAIERVSGSTWRIRIGGGPDNVEYHLFVEYGTRVNYAQPYIEPAVRAGMREWPGIAAAASARSRSPEEAYEKAIEHLARFVHAKMRAEVPVDTGDLRSSIRIEKVRADKRQKPQKIDELL